MYGYVYLTANKVNGKVYVGQHKGSEFDRKYYGSGKILKQAINKYGIENFVCKRLEMCEDLDTLNEREIYWIAKFDSTNKKYGYNITIGGGGRLGCEVSEETRKKLSIINSGENNPFYGKKHTQETIDKIIEVNTGREAWNKGKTYLDDTRIPHGKNSGMFGKTHSKEYKEILKENFKGESNPRAKTVINLDTGKIFNTIEQAGKYYNIPNPRNISGVCRGKHKTCGGFHWMYYEDYLKLQNQEVS